MLKPDIAFENLVAELHCRMGICVVRLRPLGQSPDPRAVDMLLPGLQDVDWRVRQNALQALGVLGRRGRLDR